MLDIKYLGKRQQNVDEKEMYSEIYAHRIKTLFMRQITLINSAKMHAGPHAGPAEGTKLNFINVLKIVTKWRKIQTSKLYIFKTDRAFSIISSHSTLSQ